MSWNIPQEPDTWAPQCEQPGCDGRPDEDGFCRECGEECDMEPPEDPCDRTLEDYE